MSNVKNDKVNHEKFANVVLFLLHSCSKYGAPGLIKLIKLLYFVDFNHYRKHLRPITNMNYVALQMGPAPDDYEAHLDVLISSGVVKRTTVEVYGKSRPKAEFTTSRAPNLSVFSAIEMETLEAVSRDLVHLYGGELIDETHLEGPWMLVYDAEKPGAAIPYAMGRWFDNMCDEDDLEKAVAALSRPHVKATLEALEPEFVS